MREKTIFTFSFLATLTFDLYPSNLLPQFFLSGAVFFSKLEVSTAFLIREIGDIGRMDGRTDWVQHRITSDCWLAGACVRKVKAG